MLDAEFARTGLSIFGTFNQNVAFIDSDNSGHVKVHQSQRILVGIQDGYSGFPVSPPNVVVSVVVVTVVTSSGRTYFFLKRDREE